MKPLVRWGLILASLAFFSETESREVYPWEVRGFEGSLRALQSMGQEAICTPPGEPQVRPQCAEITDDLCQTLWSNKNRGSMKVADGAIAAGQSSKSEMAASRIEDLQALIASESKLPPDLKAKAKPIFAELKTLLKKERDSKDWYRGISLALFKWETTVMDTASARTEAKHRPLKQIKQSDLSIEQKALYQSDLHHIQSEILEAKYKRHPNWKRVEKVFASAQQDMIAEIQNLNLPEAQKKLMLEKVKSVKLMLPYADPKKLAANASCGSTQMNAFYSPSHHAFTVCAGYFNSFQSESALYGTIAHEIAHAVDPLSNAEHQCRTESPVFQSLNRLVGASGPGMPCNEWEPIAAQVKASSIPETPRSFDSLQSLYDCLQPKKHLEAYSAEAVRKIAKRNARVELNSYASAHSLLTLAQPTVTKEGKETPNEFFMRPDRLQASYNGNTFHKSRNEDADVLEIFTQSLSCAKVEVDGKTISYQEAPLAHRAKIFDNAMAETLALLEASKREWYSYCGQNCSEMSVERLSVDSSENFADWMSNKALNRQLGRIKDLRDRREATALATVDLCERPGPKNDAPDLAASEKKYSLESHPDTRVRRISVFDKKNAEINQCEINQKDQGFGLCEF